MMALGFWFLKEFMRKTHFENLQVYQLAEKLADEIWKIVTTWESLAKNTVGGQQIVSEQI